MLIVLSQRIHAGVFSGNALPPSLLGKFDDDDLDQAIENSTQHLEAAERFRGADVCKVWIIQLEDGKCLYQDEIPRPKDFTPDELLSMFDNISELPPRPSFALVAEKTENVDRKS